MQEPKRKSVLDSLLNSLKITNQKSFLHRLMYVIKYNNNVDVTFGDWKTLIENICKFASDERNEDSLFGMIIYSQECATCVLEGSEDCLNKHINYLKDKHVIPQHKNKTLILLPHIEKRYFIDWQIITAKPPVLVTLTFTSFSPAEHAQMLKACVTKLLKLSEYVSQRFERDNAEVDENYSITCKRIVPEVALLEFLLNSPITESIEEYYENQRSPLPYQLYHDAVWPSPPPFIPALPK